VAEEKAELKVELPLNTPPSVSRVFVEFSKLALQGFGGVLPITQRVLCEELRWVSRKDFVESFALAQVLPGPNVCNLALMLGDRFFGARGAAAALGGMILGPLVVVLILTALYVQYAAIPQVAGALRGMGIVSAALIMATSIRLLSALKGNAMGFAACLVFGAASLVLVGLLRLPLVWCLLGLGVAAYGFAWFKVGAKA
jgi:chromate transporter